MFHVDIVNKHGDDMVSIIQSKGGRAFDVQVRLGGGGGVVLDTYVLPSYCYTMA